jgi:hypothetical protein
MSRRHSHGRGHSSGHSHNHGHDFDPHHPGAFCHTLFRRRETASADYFINILDFIRKTNETWTWELRADDKVLQMTIPCKKEQKVEAEFYLLNAMRQHLLGYDWVVVETVHNKEATYVSKKAIEKALNYKEVAEETKEPEANVGESSGS